MKIKIYTFIVLILISILLFTVPVGAINVEDESTVDSGFCGVGISWELKNDGTLYISGQGDIDNYSNEWNNESPPPWSDYLYSSSDEEITIRNVIISSGITSIGNASFEDCGNLSSVTIPDSVVTIGSRAFSDCNLQEIQLPKKLKTIMEFAFYNGLNTDTVYLPKEVEEIGYGSFALCDIGEYDVDINNEYFCDYDGALFTKDMSELLLSPKNVKIFKIPDNVKKVGHLAFYGSNIKAIFVPNTIEEFGYFAFTMTQLTDIYYAGSYDAWKNIKITSRYSDVDLWPPGIAYKDRIYTANIHYEATPWYS